MGAYTSLSVNADAQTCVNLYPEKIESEQGKSSPVLYLRPGLRLFTTMPAPHTSLGIRGMFVGEGRLFVVAGDGLYEVFEDTTVHLIGGVGNDDRMVQMAANGDQLAISSAQGLWIQDGVITAPGGSAPPHRVGFQPDETELVTARQVQYLDSYFVASDQIVADDTKSPRKFHWSSPLQGNEWDGNDVASKEAQPDMLVAILADHEDLWLFGSSSTEVWRNNYSAAPEAAPWERDPSAIIHYGCIAEFTPCRLADGVAWLAGDSRGHAQAFYAQGFQPKRVSTHAIEHEWSTYPTLFNTESFSYTDNGHHFWVLNFHVANRTWVYDMSTGLWHRRGWWNGTSLDRDRARCHGYIRWPSGAAMHLVGDWQTGKIYEMSHAFTDDAGTPIHWERACPHVANEDKRIFHARMELDMEKGTGSNFNVQLEWSNDAGHTWEPARNAATGPSGAHKTRVVWRRLGSTRDRVYRFSGSTTSKIALIDAFIELQAGQH